MATGTSHACAIVGGTAKCWGYNGSGRLGDGTTTSRDVPTAVAGGAVYSQVAAGAAHSCAIVAATGAVHCWGSGLDGRLGNGSLTTQLQPTPVTLPGPATWIATGEAHTCAVVAFNEVWCWGEDDDGRLGIGASFLDQLVPVKVVGLTGAWSASAGTLHTCATTLNGQVWCWGEGLLGRLGHGSSADTNVPVRVVNGAGTPITVAGTGIVDVGVSHSCVTGVGGLQQVACWGDGDAGKLGNGSSSNANSAQLVPGSFGASWVSAGDSHTCAVVGGSALCWGLNFSRRVGDGTLTSRNLPVLVASNECN